MEHNKTRFTIFEVKCTFYGFYKCRLCACAEIIGHSELTTEPSYKPSDISRLFSGFSYNSTDHPINDEQQLCQHVGIDS